jgi:hypothetical protein
MKRTSIFCLALLIGASLVAFGCKKKEEAVAVSPPPPVEMTAPPAGALVDSVTYAKNGYADVRGAEDASSTGRNDTQSD